MKKLGILLMITATACQSPPAKRVDTSYPDLKAYFRQEISRLSESSVEIEKEVQINQKKELKTVQRLNWEQELALFIGSDINKAAYRNLYRVEKKGQDEIYTATAPQLKTRKLKLSRKQNGEIKSILISNRHNNSLYSSEEHLEFYPDSLYRIVKRQEVSLLGTNSYQIIGKFSK